MKLLYVGCRVRIIYSPNFPGLAGKTGTIIGKEAENLYSMWRAGPWIVSVDHWGGCAVPSGPMAGTRFAPHSDQLEPILPELIEPLVQEREKEPA